MKLIRKTERVERWPNGQTKPFGLFICPHCSSEVERPLYAGQRFKSCGCQQTPPGERNPKFRHGFSGQPVYVVWAGMMARCRDRSHKSFAAYGGSGIQVCSSWKNPANFIRWAKRSGYRQGLYLDRKDHSGNYCPRNCRWLTPKQSARHKRIMKLNVSLAGLIRELKAGGVSTRELAERFRVSQGMINAVVRGRAWAD